MEYVRQRRLVVLRKSNVLSSVTERALPRAEMLSAGVLALCIARDLTEKSCTDPFFPDMEPQGFRI